jgi:hypothetical protein
MSHQKYGPLDVELTYRIVPAEGNEDLATIQPGDVAWYGVRVTVAATGESVLFEVRPDTGEMSDSFSAAHEKARAEGYRQAMGDAARRLIESRVVGYRLPPLAAFNWMMERSQETEDRSPSTPGPRDGTTEPPQGEQA